MVLAKSQISVFSFWGWGRDVGESTTRQGAIYLIVLGIDKSRQSPMLNQDLVRVAARFFSGVPHPHLLGVCCPNFFSSVGR
jgi:hypothetical protein